MRCWEGIRFSESGLFEGLYLPSNNLDGESKCCCDFVYLRFYRSGHIPRSIENLTTLEKLFLYDNELTGRRIVIENLTKMVTVAFNGRECVGITLQAGQTERNKSFIQ